MMSVVRRGLRQAGGCVAALLLTASFLSSAGRAGPPEVQILFPCGGRAGSSVELEARGKFEPWPVDVWVDRPGVTIRALESKGKLSAAIASDAAPGLYWVRLYNREGAASLVPFIVGHLPEVSEQEPNNSPRKPQMLAQNQVVVNGRLSRGGDVDVFGIDLKAGQTLVAALEANHTLAAPLDAVLEIVSPSGFVLQQNDDDSGLDPRVVFNIPKDGRYLARTYGFPATPDSSISFTGGTADVYRLTITAGPYLDYPWPLAAAAGAGMRFELFGWNLPDDYRQLTLAPAPGAQQLAVYNARVAGGWMLPIDAHRSILEAGPTSAEHPQLIEAPSTISGRIDPARDIDVFEFQAAAGKELIAAIESRTLGFPLDPVLELLDANGKSLARVDDTGADRDAELRLAIPAQGRYRLVVSDLHRQGGSRYAYRLRMSYAEPDFKLTVNKDSLAAKAGTNLEVPVKIERLAGLADEITVSIEGLPHGATAAAAKSLPQGDSGKEVKLSIVPGEVGFGPIKIVGSLTGERKLRREATAPLAGRSQRSNELWLTVVPADKKS